MCKNRKGFKYIYLQGMKNDLYKKLKKFCKNRKGYQYIIYETNK